MRRNDLLEMTAAELQIREAILLVEKMGADLRLTDAVVLLGRAQSKVADFIDGVANRAQGPHFSKIVKVPRRAFTRSSRKRGR